MKKILALALAIAMMFSLAAVSFADSFMFARVGDEALHYDLAEYYGDYFAQAFAGGLAEGSGDHLMMRNGYISYGAAAYYPIVFEGPNGDFIPSDYDLIAGLKVKAEFQQGANLVNEVSIVKMNVQSMIDTLYASAAIFGGAAPKAESTTLVEDALSAGEKYMYFVKIGVNPYITTGDEDVIGTFTFDCKQDDELNVSYSDTSGSFVDPDAEVVKVKDFKQDFGFNVHVERHYTAFNVGTIDTEDEFNIEYGKLYSLKFKNDDEVELVFGGGDDMFIDSEMNEGRFTVDVSGQGKVILTVTTDANEAIVAANPGAEMYFVNFNGVKFNRAGKFEYEMEDVAAAYMVVNNQLVPIRGLEIEDDVASFTTNMLVPYVFATSELVNPTPAA